MGSRFSLCPRPCGLDRPALQAAVESRLRAARLYTEELTLAAARLYVNVNAKSVVTVDGAVAGSTFSLQLEYKNVTDSFGKGGLATTWQSSFTGTLGNRGGPSYILSRLSQILDRFIADYLRVTRRPAGSPTGDYAQGLPKRED